MRNDFIICEEDLPVDQQQLMSNATFKRES